MQELSRRDFLKSALATAATVGLPFHHPSSAGEDKPLKADSPLHSGKGEASNPWIRAGIDTDSFLWGFRRGIRITIWPSGIEGEMPRGLFQIGYPILENGARAGLVNVMAVEPIVRGQRGFSELETSQTDRQPGKRIRVVEGGRPSEKPVAGTLTRRGRVETLKVRFLVERFENGAEVMAEAIFRTDRPDEVCWQVTHTPSSEPIESCILTATMGNYARTRLLWLQDETVDSKKLFADYQDIYFAPNTYFPLERLPRNAQGDIVVCLTTDEKHPEKETPDPRAPWWQYRGSFPVTQYWRKPRGKWQPDLHARVNGRRVYWASQIPIPNGIAYENFDLVERYVPGCVYCFGITRKEPKELARVVELQRPTSGDKG